MIELQDKSQILTDGNPTTRNDTQQTIAARSLLAILATLWPELDSVNRMKLVLGLIATLAHAGASPGFSYAIVQVFDTFFLATGYKSKTLLYSMAVLGIAVADGLAVFFMQYLLASVSQYWADKLRNAAMKRVLQQPKAWFEEETNTPSTLVSSLDGNGEEMQVLVGRFAAQILVVVVMMAMTLVWSFATCWKLTVVSLAATPLLYALTKSFEVVSARWESRTKAAGDEVGDIFVDTFSDIKTVRSLTLEAYFHQKYSLATAAAFSTGTRRALFSGLLFGLSDSGITFFTPMIFWYGASLARREEWPVKAILTVFSLLLFCTASANAVVKYLPQINTAVDAANRLLRLARMSSRSHEDVGQVKLDRTAPQTFSGPVHFINQTFCYPTRPDLPALRRLNLAIPSGRCTAIVGPSGSGKSTIASLILGLYPTTPDESAFTDSEERPPPSLTLSGRDIRTLDIRTLRSLVACVPQQPVILPTTARENISYGLHAASASRIEAAARSAGVHEFIQSLPQGYATVIGEGGLGISGGQAQRIVIARALVRDPQVLILDEATSALDVESAEIIRQTVLDVIRKKHGKLTVIVVTHSRDMMSFADHVVVLEAGSVAEQGSFNDLLASKGKLWELLSSE
jgi:ATP-binding cassette subfamily B (MDR/TAP) protein 1